MDWKDKITLITGASSGIGRETSLIAAKKGARLILTARRKKELLDLSDEIEASGGIKPYIIPADIATPEGKNKITGEIIKHFGSLQILINNAGITAHGRFDETKPDIIRKTMEINFFAMAELTMELLPVIKAASGRKIILYVSTPSGLYGIPDRCAYSTSKAAGTVLMDTLRMELKAFDIHTINFCPGYTRTHLRAHGISGKGAILSEDQSVEAKSVHFTASKLIACVEKERRIGFTDKNGWAVFLLRSIWPGLLERLILKKLQDELKPKS